MRSAARIYQRDQKQYFLGRRSKINDLEIAKFAVVDAYQAQRDKVVI